MAARAGTPSDSEHETPMIVLWLSPLAIFVGLILIGRSPLFAGWGGTLMAGFVTWLSGPSQGDLPRIFSAFLGGLWIALPAVLVILAGLAFALAIERPAKPAEARPASASRIAEICLLQGPFMESATGFGVGYAVALMGLRQAGLGNVNALSLAAFSQLLVPWGALGIGTRISAAIVGMDTGDLGWRIALVAALLWLVLIPLFWKNVGLAGVVPTRSERLGWAALLTVLMALLVVANLVLPIDLAALAALGIVIVARFLALQGWSGVDRRLLRRLSPFAILIACLTATQMWAPLRSVLSAPDWKPIDNLPGFSPWLSPAIPMLLIACAWAAAKGGSGVSALAIETTRRGWRAALLTFLLVGMAWIMVRGGIAAAVMAFSDEAFGIWAAGVVPLAGAAGGYLTGSNTGAGALSMPLANGLSLTTEARLVLVSAAIVAGSLMTALSPVRSAMGVALCGATADEVQTALSRQAPFAMIVVGLTLIIGIAASITL